MIIVTNNGLSKDLQMFLISCIKYVDAKNDTQITKDDNGISIELNIGYEDSPIQYENIEINSQNIQFKVDANNTLLAFDDTYLFLALSYSPIEGIHEAITKSKYNEILNILADMKYDNLIRVWNYIPSINQDNPNGLENYKDFCAGRAEAFEEHYENSHYKMPSASALGINGDKDIIYLIAKKDDAINKIYHIENSRQIPAYNYPKQYGIKSPSFARATLEVQNDRLKLFVSGTASVVGSKSIHDTIEEQTLETIKNIKTVSSLENINQYTNLQLKDELTIEHAKVYVRNRSDIDIVKKIWEDEMSFYNNIYCHTNICREELLVEIECIYSNK
ncbi:MAG: hypothetical protein QM493_09490 [Sulfurovum sp.]